VKADVYVVGGDNINLTMCGSFQGKVSFLLPAGEYEIKAHSESPDLNSRGVHFSIPQGVAKFDLGVIELVLPRDTQSYWTVRDGLPKPLASYVGQRCS